MGILNVTPDSFSDGGTFDRGPLAIEHGLRMMDEGADIIDVGGESTRPGARPVSAQEEMDRVLPVIAALAQQGAALISVDTSKALVALAALQAGAHIVNDVSGFREFEGMVEAAKTHRAGVVLMHMQGRPETMQEHPAYADTVSEVGAFLETRRDRVIQAGLSVEQLVLDPGIGFGKTLEDNLALLRAIPELTERLGPLLIGLSRKRMIGSLTGCEVADRLAGSLAGLAWSVMQGAQIIRVHDVKESCESVKVLDILRKNYGNR